MTAGGSRRDRHTEQPAGLGHSVTVAREAATRAVGTGPSLTRPAGLAFCRTRVHGLLNIRRRLSQETGGATCHCYAREGATPRDKTACLLPRGAESLGAVAPVRREQQWLSRVPTLSCSSLSGARTLATNSKLAVCPAQCSAGGRDQTVSYSYLGPPPRRLLSLAPKQGRNAMFSCQGCDGSPATPHRMLRTSPVFQGGQDGRHTRIHLCT